MCGPYFSSYCNAPSRPLFGPNVRGIPVQKLQRVSSPKVVSIPVRFVGSDGTRSKSAVKIQKVFRGFLVRKSVKKIAAIRREVKEIDEEVSKKETVELIRKDSKERVRVNETLMNLLFRLDSVRGVDSGVRDCRKAVIKKAIALQEVVDAIAAGNETPGADIVEAGTDVDVVDQKIEDKDETELPIIDGPVDTTQTLAAQSNTPPIGHSTSDIGNVSDTCNEIGVDRNIQLPNDVDSILDCEELKETPEANDTRISSETTKDSVDSSGGNWINDLENGKDVSKNYVATESVEDNLRTSEAESQLDSSANPCSWEGDEGETDIEEAEGMEIVCHEKKEEKVKGISGCGAEEENAGNKNLLERMMEDNEKMNGLMRELLERNAVQTRLISSFSQRAEQLEKAFICDNLRRKKRQAACTVEAPDKFPDSKKSGKR